MGKSSEGLVIRRVAAAYELGICRLGCGNL
jgi:hypothetical protein